MNILSIDVTEETREARLRQISKEFGERLARDPDNGGPLEGWEKFYYYEKLAKTEFKPEWENIPKKGIYNKIRRHFHRVFSEP